jgi:hypothetical protein
MPLQYVPSYQLLKRSWGRQKGRFILPQRRYRIVNLHLHALPAGVLQPSSYRLEGIADHDVDVLVLWICVKVLLAFFVATSDGAV